MSVFTSSLHARITLKFLYMETKQKEIYVAPAMQIVEVKTEGIICESNPDPNYKPWDNQNW